MKQIGRKKGGRDGKKKIEGREYGRRGGGARLGEKKGRDGKKTIEGMR